MAIQKKEYHETSPYFNTELYGKYLDVLEARTFTFRADDVDYQIESGYAFSPQKLAYALYGDTRLWWEFSVRNPNTLVNPLLDFQAGVWIKVPYKQTLIDDLGI